MRNRYRWMYRMTGQPGWMRFDFPPFSPMPGFLQPGFTIPYDPWGAAEITPEQELYFLKTEAEQLEDALYAIEKRIKELEVKE